VGKDYVEAVGWFRKAADQNLAIAQYDLGVMYNNGSGVPQDYAEAVRWYRKAAEQNYADAQGRLGVLYQEGLGVPQDYVEAHKWFNLASAQGDTLAKKNLQICERLMTAMQIAEAQRLAREFTPRSTPPSPN
jgi:TPR repeat protein